MISMLSFIDMLYLVNFHQLRQMKPKVVFADKKNVLEMYALLAFLLQENIFPYIILFPSRSANFKTLDDIVCGIPAFHITDFTCSSRKNDTDTVVILHTFNAMTVEKNIEISHSTFLSLIDSHVDFIFNKKTSGFLNSNLGSYQELCLYVKAIITLSPIIIWRKMDFLFLCDKIKRSKVT